MAIDEMIGKRFGRLLVVSVADVKSGHKRYNCFCDCGNTSIVDKSSLLHGKTRSCGCLSKEATSLRSQISGTDIIGKRFGKLVVLELYKKESRPDKRYDYYYKCKCDCGKEIIIKRLYLLRGTESCGCINSEINSARTRLKPETFIGRKYGRLTIIGFDHQEEGKDRLKYFFKVKCDCGTEFITEKVNLTSGHTKSCGCIPQGNYIHGECYTNFYIKYQHMNDRCLYNSKHNIAYYKGRNIKVCDRWARGNPNGYSNFKEDTYDSYVAHVDKYGIENTTLERIDVDKDYSPDNCCWATWEEQMNNTQRTRRYYYYGYMYTINELMDKIGYHPSLNRSVISDRLNKGWSAYLALSIPINQDTSDLQSPIIFNAPPPDPSTNATIYTHEYYKNREEEE